MNDGSTDPEINELKLMAAGMQAVRGANRAMDALKKIGLTPGQGLVALLVGAIALDKSLEGDGGSLSRLTALLEGMVPVIKAEHFFDMPETT